MASADCGHEIITFNEFVDGGDDVWRGAVGDGPKRADGIARRFEGGLHLGVGMDFVIHARSGSALEPEIKTSPSQFPHSMLRVIRDVTLRCGN